MQDTFARAHDRVSFQFSSSRPGKVLPPLNSPAYFITTCSFSFRSSENEPK